MNGTALGKIQLSLGLAVGLLLVCFAICDAQALDGQPHSINALLVVTATVTPADGAVLSYTLPYTTTIHVPAGAVTETVMMTLTRHSRPAHPPTAPWIGWVGTAFALSASGPVSTFTATAYFSPILANYSWALRYWDGIAWQDAAESCTPPSTYLRGQAWLSVGGCGQVGDFVVSAAPFRYHFPIVRRSQ